MHCSTHELKLLKKFIYQILAIYLLKLQASSSDIVGVEFNYD